MSALARRIRDTRATGLASATMQRMVATPTAPQNARSPSTGRRSATGITRSRNSRRSSPRRRSRCQLQTTSKTPGATNLIKPVVDRTIHGGFLAYPSGHTAGATAFAIVAGLLLVSILQLGRWGGLLVVTAIAAAVGGVAAWAQIVLVAHYPTDAVGGFLMAAALVRAAAMLIDLLADRIVAVSRSSHRR